MPALGSQCTLFRAVCADGRDLIKCVSKVLGHSLKASSAHICPRTFETHFTIAGSQQARETSKPRVSQIKPLQSKRSFVGSVNGRGRSRSRPLSPSGRAMIQQLPPTHLHTSPHIFTIRSISVLQMAYKLTRHASLFKNRLPFS